MSQVICLGLGMFISAFLLFYVDPGKVENKFVFFDQRFGRKSIFVLFTGEVTSPCTRMPWDERGSVDSELFSKSSRIMSSDVLWLSCSSRHDIAYC